MLAFDGNAMLPVHYSGKHLREYKADATILVILYILFEKRLQKRENRIQNSEHRGQDPSDDKI